MAHPLKHAEISAKKFGGEPADYIGIHNWFDESKAYVADFRHRALRHHSDGIFLAEKIFGLAITNSDGKQVPVRYIGEQHVKDDLGRIPTVQDWIRELRPQRWMYGRQPKLEAGDAEQGLLSERASRERGANATGGGDREATSA
jgi:hypothetical protein